MNEKVEIHIEVKEIKSPNNIKCILLWGLCRFSIYILAIGVFSILPYILLYNEHLRLTTWNNESVKSNCIITENIIIQHQDLCYYEYVKISNNFNYTSYYSLDKRSCNLNDATNELNDNYPINNIITCYFTLIDPKYIRLQLYDMTNCVFGMMFFTSFGMLLLVVYKYNIENLQK